MLKRLLGNIGFKVNDIGGRYKQKNGRGRIAVLMYHGLETKLDRLACNSLDVTPESCLREIRFFIKQGYQPISADKLRRLEKNDKGNYLLITFDDGHANIYFHIKRWLVDEKLPILVSICPKIIDQNKIFWWEEVRARFMLMRLDRKITVETSGLSKTFSACEVESFEDYCRGLRHEEMQRVLEQLNTQTDYISERKILASPFIHKNMSWEEIRDLDANDTCTIAAHSLEHEISTKISAEELAARTVNCKERIESEIQREIAHYVYPNGEYSNGTDEVIKKCGFEYTYSTVDKLNYLSEGTFRLNRFMGYGLSGNLRYYSYLWNSRHQVV